MSPASGVDAASESVRQSQNEVGFSASGISAGNRQRDRTCRKPPAERHQSRTAVIAGVKDIQPLAFVLNPGAENMLALRDDKRVFKMNHRLSNTMLVVAIGAA